MLQLYKNIKRRRIELKLNQTDLALKIGYADKSMIAKIENGLIDLPQSKIIEFANALQTTPQDLMGWEEEKEDDISFDDFRFALYGEVKDLTEGQKEDLLNFARFLKSNNK